MIDIIIPAYNAHDTIRRTLNTIAYQNIIDKIKVTIVNDASDKDYSDEVNYYSSFMDIKEIKLDKNSGPGVARQTGIDNTKEDYIMFIDSDDILFSPVSVFDLYNSIIEDDSDICISSFLAEESKFCFVEKENDRVWLHGKIYKREFLKDNNVTFNDTYANEDNGFNQLAFLCGAKVKTIPIITYVWCENKNSITRKNNKRYRYTGLSGYIYNICWAIEGAIERGYISDELKELIFRTLVSIYFYYLENISVSTTDPCNNKHCQCTEYDLQ